MHLLPKITHYCNLYLTIYSIYKFWQTTEEWQYVFLITASVYLAGAIAYGLMASGDRQEWSR